MPLTDTVAASSIVASLLIGRWRPLHDAAKALPGGPTQMRDIRMVTVTGTTRTFVFRRRPESRLRHSDFRYALAESIGLDLTFPSEHEVRATRNLIRTLEPELIQPWYFVEPDHGTDPAVALFQPFLWNLCDYFISLDPSEDDAAATAADLANDTVSSLVTGRGHVVEEIALDGPWCQEPLRHSWLSVRPLTDTERGNLSAPSSPDYVSDFRAAGDSEAGPCGTSVLAAASPWTITDAPELSTFALERAILAMQLLSWKVGSTGGVHVHTVPRFPDVASRRVALMIGEGVRRQVSQDDLVSVVDLADLLPRGAVVDPETRREVALNRFLRGSSSRNAADSLLEHTIGLEAVLLPGKFEGELGFRLRLTAALLLGQDSASREQIARDLKRIYSLRSALVHGLKPPARSELKDVATKAQELLARLLLICIRTGWPSEEAISRMPFRDVSTPP